MKVYGLIILLFVLNSSFVRAQWIQVYQTDTCNCPDGLHLPVIGMTFFGKDSGVVCSKKYGVKGSVATTTNGGKTWSKNPLDTNITVTSSAFTDINHIWFVFREYIYRSSDAGRNWQIYKIHDPVNSSVECLYFQDSLTGFVGKGGLSLLRTSDGGKNWNRVHDPEKPQDDFYNVHQIAFSGPKYGLAIGADYRSFILRTTDAGFTWKRDSGSIRSEVQNTANSLSYPDPKHAFLSTTFGYLYSSSDSGKTWNQVGEAMSLGTWFQSISFLDSLHGLATGGSYSPHSYPLTIGYTSDGGRNWRTVSIDSESSEDFASFPDPNVAYISGYDAIFKLNTKDLSVIPTNPFNSISPSIEFDGDRAAITIPGDFSGKIRIVDLLGRTLEERTIAPASKVLFSLRGMPRQIFIEVYSQNQFKVFKVLH